MLEENIKKEIKKCSRCALCLQNCPIYKIKKDENNTPRGLICKLLGYDKNILRKKDISQDLKICLNCTKCKSSCPSKINTSSIFAYKNAHFSPSKISQRILLNLKLLPIKFLYFINFFKRKKPAFQNSNIYYFKGCIPKAQHKITFIDKITNCANFKCCGLPYLTSGDLKNYNKAKEINTQIIKKSSLVIFDCASCYSAVMEYDTLAEEDRKKLFFFNDFIKEKGVKLKNNSKYKNKTVTFHKPCHLSNDEFLKIENFISSIKDINYKRLEDYDSCCGFGGSYFLYHPIIALKIALKKAKNIKKTKPDLILTMCPSCTIGLRFNQLISFNFKKTLELRDFIQNEAEFKN